MYLKVHLRMVPTKTRQILNIQENDFDDNGYIYMLRYPKACTDYLKLES